MREKLADTTPPGATGNADAARPLHFRAVLQLHGKTATGFEVPPAVVAALGAGKRPAVGVTINGYTYRSTVAPLGGVFMVPVSAAIRAEAGGRRARRARRHARPRHRPARSHRTR